ncbi:hypothetical protein CAEBREN_16978 [Caenorhabditis brenneri]|uniref:Uncharacterized protein n=1 Tax=Caenorhabditis brenneri TaxID=135651 RepID=G0MSM3_CAEBE|nr:hypothetical protein CAEBREN_16978 [Caenorhabditis brenneri]
MRQDVTIELDFDDETWSDLDVLNDKELEEDEDDVIISDPVTLAEVSFNLPGSVRIKNLSQELRDLLAVNLDLPPTVTIGTWSMVKGFLSANDAIQGEANEKNIKDIWKPYKHMHAQILVNALCKAERIDLLAQFKWMVENNCYLQIGEETPEPPEPAAPVSMFKPGGLSFVPVQEFQPIDASKIILVLHYETNEIEKTNYRWFFDNFSEHLKSRPDIGLTALDVAKLKKNDGGNRIQMLEHVYPQFAHIVVCFNDSYIKEIRKSECVPKFKFCRSIQRKTDEEFVQNDNRNLRCRCVVMPGIKERINTNWAIMTTMYHWPEDHKDFLQRILNLDKLKVKYANPGMMNVTL